MSIWYLRIRDGGFFVAPEEWIQDFGTYYECNLILFRRIIHKSSIDREIHLSYWVGIPLSLLLIVLGLARVSIKLVSYVVRQIWRLT